MQLVQLADRHRLAMTVFAITLVAARPSILRAAGGPLLLKMIPVRGDRARMPFAVPVPRLRHATLAAHFEVVQFAELGGRKESCDPTL